MRAIWSGHLKFGLVTIPVGLAVARQRQEICFRSLHRECGTPIRQQRHCPACERAVEGEELVKGYEFSLGQFVLVEEDEMELVMSRAIEISRLIDLAAVDPLLFDRTWWLVPAKDPVGARPYVLLERTLAELGAAALATLTAWKDEHQVLVHSLRGLLALTTLYVPSEIRDPRELAERLAELDVAEPELELARRLARALHDPKFDPASLERERNAGVRELIEAKIAGREISVARPEEAAPADVAEALRRSIAAARADKGARRREASVAK